MFDIEIRRTFSAAHQLKGYDGDCRNLHGHNYNVIAVVRTAKLNEIGIALDFKLLKAAVDEVIEKYDHRNLSELPEFQEINPTSEVLAQTIYRQLAGRLNKDGMKIARVSIAESSASRVIYSE